MIVDNSDDQDTTDLHKCIAYVLDFVSDDDKSNVSRNDECFYVDVVGKRKICNRLCVVTAVHTCCWCTWWKV